MGKPDDRDEAMCMWARFTADLTSIMRVLGVQETVELLRSCANKLESNRELLESKRSQRPQERGQA